MAESKAQQPGTSGKKALGANVDSFLKREAHFTRAEDYCTSLANVAASAKWVESQEKRGRVADRRRNELAMVEELEAVNYELTIRRRARLQDLYTELEDQYERELNDMGLALVRDRD